MNQGLDDFDSLVEFTKADMKTLCTTICRPGGMIINPRANITDQPPTISEPGHIILVVAYKRLLITAYAAMYQARTSIPIDSKSMTQPFIMSLAPLQKKSCLTANHEQQIIP